MNKPEQPLEQLPPVVAKLSRKFPEQQAIFCVAYTLLQQLFGEISPAQMYEAFLDRHPELLGQMVDGTPVLEVIKAGVLTDLVNKKDSPSYSRRVTAWPEGDGEDEG